MIFFKARLCTNEDCTGKPDRRTGTKECTVEDVPDEGKIVSLEIIDQRRKSRCISGENYGFYTRSIWISRKCEADFRVCFVTGISLKCSKVHVQLYITYNDD